MAAIAGFPKGIYRLSCSRLNRLMQTRDQKSGLAQGSSSHMRSFPLIASSLAFTTLAFAHPVPANVEDDPNWQTCIGLSTMPDSA
jgi:hypothetical protein